MKNIFFYIIALGISLSAGFIGSLFTTPAIDGWYAGLVRPDIAPPNWIFGPVWTTLFILMGTASFLVWREGFGREAVRKALLVFLVQLVLNTAWSILFFGLQSPGAALIEILILWLSIAITIRLFSRISRTAAWLLVPYIAWVSFATYLNYQFWILN